MDHRRWGYLLMTVASLLATALAPPLEARTGQTAGGSTRWVGLWSAMPQLVESYNLPPTPFNGSDAVVFNSTIRQTLPVSLEAQEIRLYLSNAFGVNDLDITHVSMSLPSRQKSGLSSLQPGSTKTVSFSGDQGIIIPDSGLAVSDHWPADDLFPCPRIKVNGRNLTGSSVRNTEHWYFISGVEGRLPSQSRSFAIIGDSITDGHATIDNANGRWPDFLLAKMQKHRATENIAVLNQAAGGNRILHDGLGPNVISRIDRDMLAQPNVQYVMIFEGVNDIGIAAIDIATRVHAAGLPFLGATITPFGSPPTSNYSQPYSNPEREKTRLRINSFIRGSGVFDAVLDFDAVLRNPEAPSQLLPEYDCGDHFHPNEAGYRTLADYFPLGVFGY